MLRKKTSKSLFGLVFGLLTAAGTFKALDHHTTALFLFIAAILLFFITAFLRMAQKLSKLGATTSTLKKSLSTSPAPIALPAPPPAAIAQPPSSSTQPKSDPSQKPQKEAPLFTGTIPFDALPPEWPKYTEDKFYKIIWHWHYTPEFDNEPHGVKPSCPECGREIGGYRYSDGRTGGYAVYIECKFHPSINYTCGYDDYAQIRKLIRQKIDDGSYDKVVTRLRTHRKGWISN